MSFKFLARFILHRLLILHFTVVHIFVKVFLFFSLASISFHPKSTNNSALPVPTSQNLQNAPLYYCTTSRQKRTALLLKILACYANLLSLLPLAVVLHDLHVHGYTTKTRKWDSSNILYHSLSFLRIK